jgi:hypothetical protein
LREQLKEKNNTGKSWGRGGYEIFLQKGTGRGKGGWWTNGKRRK